MKNSSADNPDSAGKIRLKTWEMDVENLRMTQWWPENTKKHSAHKAPRLRATHWRINWMKAGKLVFWNMWGENSDGVWLSKHWKHGAECAEYSIFSLRQCDLDWIWGNAEKIRLRHRKLY
jgi:hypothetical protein